MNKLDCFFNNTRFFYKKQNSINLYKCLYVYNNDNIFNYIKQKCLENNIKLFIQSNNIIKYIKLKDINNLDILLKPKHHNNKYKIDTLNRAKNSLNDNNYTDIDILITHTHLELNKNFNYSIIIILENTNKEIDNYNIIEKTNSYSIYQKNNSILYPLYYKIKKKPIIIMGNGPSLKTLINMDLNKISKKYDTIGLNASYRYFEKINWFPTYFGSFDSKVTPYHSENIINYINNSNGITKKYLTITGFLPSKFHNKKIIDHRKCHRCFNPNWWFCNTGNACSGHSAFKFALQEGYTEIYLIGIDANYKDYIKGSSRCKNGGLIIKNKIKENVNYFFNDYQQIGDIYNIPGSNGHLNSWFEAFINLKFNNHLNINIYNSSKISKVKYFKYKEIKI